MKLGQINPITFKKCRKCKRVIMNKRHERYYKCYIKEKIEMIHENPRSNIEEYYINNNFNHTVINKLGFVDFKKNKRNIRILSVNP